MPSSSNHDTYQEIRIFRSFKIAFGRFFHQGLHREASELCRLYANLLEVPKSVLTDHLRNNQAAWLEQKKEFKKDVASEAVWKASNDVSDTAGLLLQFGRDEEGKNFGELAENIQAMAERIQADEERCK